MFLLPRELSHAILPVLLAAIAGIAALALWPEGSADDSHSIGRSEVGLMTGLPIYWADGADISALLSEETELPWVRQVLEKRYDLRPIGQLEAGQPNDASELDDLKRLLIVQPRGISPAGNVALDDWLNGGGRLLFVLDPMLTGEYAAPLGDPRHPPVVGLIPPVFARWGLAMEQRKGQSAEPYMLDTVLGKVPVSLAGRIVASDGGMGDCSIEGSGLIARCAVGEGQVTVLADAALFELDNGSAAQADLILALVEYALR